MSDNYDYANEIAKNLNGLLFEYVFMTTWFISQRKKNLFRGFSTIKDYIVINIECN